MKKILSLIIFSGGFLLKAQNQVINPYPRTISVTGSAEMDLVPDEIYVQVDLKEYKKKNEKVTLENIKTNFLNTCKAIDIPDSAISILAYEGNNFNYMYWRKRKNDPDMLAAISYQVKCKQSQKIDELIDRLDDEATVNFHIIRTSHSRIMEYRKQLKIEAIKAAREKAVYLAAAINETPGEAVTITEPVEYTENIYPQMKTSNTSLMEITARGAIIHNDNGQPIDFKKLTVKYDVQVLFALK